MSYDFNEPVIQLGLAIAGLIVFGLLWNKQRALAWIVLAGLGGYLLYMGVNWRGMREGHFLNWRQSGLVGAIHLSEY